MKALAPLVFALIAAGAPNASARPELKQFDSAAAALSSLLVHKPRVIGIGEYHEVEGETPKGVPSAIARFTAELLDVLAPLSSDIVLETWITEGRCGKREEEVVGKVEDDTKRPETTESELVTMLKKAKAAGVQPHILTLSCLEYLLVSDGKGGVDYVRLLARIKDLLERKVAEVLAEQKDRGRMVLVYGGALHNDLRPRPELADYTYAPAVRRMVKGRFLELDLYVPEFIERDEELTKEPWYALLRRVEKGKTALIRRSEASYIIVFPRTELPVPPPAPAPATPPAPAPAAT